jgi:8-oxo-dGTP pyrophosphatase MutT (NUDIX family)
MATAKDAVQQVAVIAVRGRQICLVTSQNGKRWVVPKGCLESGMSAGQVALQEAWEEAGLVGVLDREPVGSYLYEKAGEIYHVIVFQMQATHVSADWPEASSRHRCWLPPEKARLRVQHAGLRHLITSILEVPVILGLGVSKDDDR